MKKIKRKCSNKYLGYFTGEIIKDGEHYFEFTRHKHASLRKVSAGSVFRKGQDDSFQVKLIISEEKRNYVRQLIKDGTLIVAEFENGGGLIEVYTLEPQGVCDIFCKF